MVCFRGENQNRAPPTLDVGGTILWAGVLDTIHKRKKMCNPPEHWHSVSLPHRTILCLPQWFIVSEL